MCKLAPPAASYEPPVSSEIAQLLKKDGTELDVVLIWDNVMTYVGTLGAKPLTWGQLVESLLSHDNLAVRIHLNFLTCVGVRRRNNRNYLRTFYFPRSYL